MLGVVLPGLPPSGFRLVHAQCRPRRGSLGSLSQYVFKVACTLDLLQSIPVLVSKKPALEPRRPP